MNRFLPRANAALVTPQMSATTEFRRFLESLASFSDASELQAIIDGLIARLIELESLSRGNVIGLSSVSTTGDLSGGDVYVMLAGDLDAASPISYYGTDDDGAKGWHDLSLDALSDVDAPTPADGDSIVWSDGDEKWNAAPVTKPGDPVSSLDNDAGYLSTAVLSIVAGTNITIDDTDPENPVVNATGGGGGGAVDSVNGQTGVVVLDASDVGAATAAQGTLADSAVQPGDLATVATTGDVGDLVGFPGGTTDFLRADGTFSAPPSGGGGSSVGLHSVPIMAGAIQPSASGGSGAVTSTASGSNLPDIVGLAFSATTRQNAQFAIPMPKSWNEGTITARFLWRHPATTVNFGVRWGIQAVGVGDGETIAAAYGTAQEVSDTGGSTNFLYRSDETSPMTVGGSPAAEDVVYFRVYRDPAHASDNMAVAATLIGVVLYMTTDAGTDA